MKLTHIINVGYPKSGTTWLWSALADQPWFSAPREKENRDLTLGIKTIERYIDDYRMYNITANFDTSMFAIDRFVIRQLQQISNVTTSIILRNPFEIYWSQYNFLPGIEFRYSYDEYTNNLYDQGWFNRTDLILDRWQDVFSSDRFNVFFYDDLKSNPGTFFANYCKRLNLPLSQLGIHHRINQTTYKNNNAILSNNTIKLINIDIDRLQAKIDRDITHWKQ